LTGQQALLRIKTMSLIAPFDPWKSPICTCPAKYSLSAYTGCGHGCLYCYASSYIPDFRRMRPKKDFLKRLSREIKKIPASSHITMANSSDPYTPLEEKLKLTREALSLIAEHDVKVSLVTKSGLILRDLDIIKRIKKIIACISMTTLDENLAGKLEPGAPPPAQRLKAVKTLSEYLPVAVRFDPLIYGINTEDIDKIVKEIADSGARQIITSTYKARPDNFRRMLLAFAERKNQWENLYYREGEKISGSRYLAQDLRRKLLERVRDAAVKCGLLFSSCREGLSSLNTAHCDGSSLFPL
jgi:DNA repair photolyase